MKNNKSEANKQTAPTTVGSGDLLGHWSMSLNLGMNLISYQCVRAGKLLNKRKHSSCALVVVRQTRVKTIIICYRSGKQLNRIAALAELNHLDGSNRSGCVLPITALNPLIHLFETIGYLVVGVSVR